MKTRSVGPRWPGWLRAVPRWSILALVIGLIAASCGGDSPLVFDSTSAPTTKTAAPATTLAATITTAAATTTAVTTTTGVTPGNAAAPLFEAEDLFPVAGQDVYLEVQDMSAWGAQNWSGGTQLFVGTEVGGTVGLVLDVPNAGEYQINVFATRAPDFGVVLVSFSNGVVLSDVIDLYGSVVAPTGLIQLEPVLLEAGPQVMTFEVVDKNPSSTGFNLGVDVVQLAPVSP